VNGGGFSGTIRSLKSLEYSASNGNPEDYFFPKKMVPGVKLVRVVARCTRFDQNGAASCELRRTNVPVAREEYGRGSSQAEMHGARGESSDYSQADPPRRAKLRLSPSFPTSTPTTQCNGSGGTSPSMPFWAPPRPYRPSTEGEAPPEPILPNIDTHIPMQRLGWNLALHAVLGASSAISTLHGGRSSA
jgi:hypothetical protein